MADQPNTNTTHLDGTLTVRIASWLDLPRSLFPLGISVIFKNSFTDETVILDNGLIY